MELTVYIAIRGMFLKGCTRERLGSLVPVCARQACLADVSVRIL